mgnify:CR=1 FL=1
MNYNKLSITSNILFILGILFLFLGFFPPFSYISGVFLIVFGKLLGFYSVFIPPVLFFLGGIIVSIISLNQINKKPTKGKILSWLSLILSVICLVLMIGLTAFQIINNLKQGLPFTYSDFP